MIVKSVIPSYKYTPNPTRQFCVDLIDVPVVEEDNAEFPRINKDRTNEAICRALSEYPSRFRGGHVKFLMDELRFSTQMLSVLLDYPEMESWVKNEYGTCVKWRVERDLRFWLAQLFYPDDDTKIANLFRTTRTSKKFDNEYKVICVDANTFEYSYR